MQERRNGATTIYTPSTPRNVLSLGSLTGPSSSQTVSTSALLRSAHHSSRMVLPLVRLSAACLLVHASRPSSHSSPLNLASTTIWATFVDLWLSDRLKLKLMIALGYDQQIFLRLVGKYHPDRGRIHWWHGLCESPLWRRRPFREFS